MKNLTKSLAKFHESMGNVQKEASNPFFKSKYAPLESILPAIKGPMKEAGLTFTQIPTGLCKLKTIVFDVESGESIEGEFEMTPAKNDPQGQGGAITYMRRYALVSMLGLNCDEDDDGNTASQAPKAKKVAEVKISSDEAKKLALQAIEECDSIDSLSAVDSNVRKSKNLSQEHKNELLSIIKGKIEEYDPLA